MDHVDWHYADVYHNSTANNRSVETSVVLQRRYRLLYGCHISRLNNVCWVIDFI